MVELRRSREPVDSETDRVRRSTDQEVLQGLDKELRRSVRALEGSPDRIRRRIVELDREWSIERALEVNASSLIMIGIAVSRFGLLRGWLALPFVVAAFLLQHGVQGWCPPLPVLRRFGLRSRKEIDAEKFALKALRGDFDLAAREHDADRALAAVRR